MIDKRLLKETKSIKGYGVILAAVSFAAAFLTLVQFTYLCRFIEGVVFEKKGVSPVQNLAYFTVAFLLRAVVTSCKDRFGKNTAAKIKHDLKRRGMNAVLRSKVLLVERQSSVEWTSRILDSVELIEPYFGEFLPHLIYTAIVLPMVAIYAFYLDPLSAGILLFTAPLVPVFMILIGKTGAYVSSRQWHTLKEMNGFFGEMLKGMTTLKHFSRVERQVKRMADLDHKFRENTLKVLRITFLSALVLELLTTISTALVAVSLGIRLLEGRISFYPAFLVLLMTPEYFQPLRQLGLKYHIANNGRMAADSLFEVFSLSKKKSVSGNTISEVDGSEEKKIAEKTNMSEQKKMVEKKSIPEKEPIIKICGLSYGYGEASTVLKDVHMEVHQNGLYGITGDSGAGKSTLGKLLMGFDEMYHGSIRIHGKEIKEADVKELRKKIGYVPQHPILLNGTLRENLCLDRKPIKEEVMEKALEDVGLSSLLSALPKGFDTVLGEGGRVLSGGQIQRIGIARAIMKGAEIILLDEPTSALDLESEAHFLQLLEAMKKQTCIIVIAHRVATLEAADEVFFLDHGLLAGRGNHAELLEKNVVYRRKMQEWGGEYDMDALTLY